MRASCRLVRGAVDLALASLTAPRLLLSRFVSNPGGLADTLRTFRRGELYCEIFVTDRGRARISDYLVGNGYAPAAANGDLLHGQRAFRGLVSDYRLFTGGPSGTASIAIVVAVHSSLQSEEHAGLRRQQIRGSLPCPRDRGRGRLPGRANAERHLIRRRGAVHLSPTFRSR